MLAPHNHDVVKALRLAGVRQEKMEKLLRIWCAFGRGHQRGHARDLIDRTESLLRELNNESRK